MVEKIKTENEEKYITKKSLNMKVLPEFQKFLQSQKKSQVGLTNDNYIKGHNGRFHQLVWNSEKRRTTKNERKVWRFRRSEVRN